MTFDEWLKHGQPFIPRIGENPVVTVLRECWACAYEAGGDDERAHWNAEIDRQVNIAVLRHKREALGKKKP